jgi:hypothetical protein
MFDYHIQNSQNYPMRDGITPPNGVLKPYALQTVTPLARAVFYRASRESL